MAGLREPGFASAFSQVERLDRYWPSRWIPFFRFLTSL
jgi:hypothetical protein